MFIIWLLPVWGRKQVQDARFDSHLTGVKKESFYWRTKTMAHNKGFPRLAHKSSFSASSATVSAKRDGTSAEREARASERKLVPGPTSPDQKTMRTTLRKSKAFRESKNKFAMSVKKFTRSKLRAL